MSWIQKLHETYEHANVRKDVTDDNAFLPISHISQQAHIQITLDGSGNFCRGRAKIVAKENTLIPATEDSAGRTGDCAPHPLNDKIQFVAGDYLKYGGKKNSYFENVKVGKVIKDGYLSLLTKWNNAFPNPKLKAVLSYVEKRTVVKNLVEEGILHLDSQGKLLIAVGSDKNQFPILKLLPQHQKTKVRDQGDAFVRWCVEIEGIGETQTWTDEELVKSWVEYDSKLQTSRGICFVSGAEQTLGTKHPARLRHGGDKAKLISSNDTTGYTYLGRFTDSEQACSVGYETSQKAHCALRWLIQRQSFRNEDQVIVAWEVSGKKMPSLLVNSAKAFEEDDSMEIRLDDASNGETSYKGDFGQAYARKLKAKIAGYRRELDSSNNIVVMGLDSATTGRMAITYYRELMGSDFLHRLETWHKNFAWFQNYSKEVKFVGAPAPKEIAEAAFGRRLDAKISKMTVNRILPCIVDGVPFPLDLVHSTCNRAANRAGIKHWEWEKVLGIACALFNGINKGGYKMELETERPSSRDYLYGRLLAVAEHLESRALYIAGESRDTNAAKLMQRFSMRPYSTWLQIELSLSHHKTRLQARRPEFLYDMKNLLGAIHSMFKAEEYTNDAPLTGLFLLGYHCQRRDLQLKTKKGKEEPSSFDTKEEANIHGAQSEN